MAFTPKTLTRVANAQGGSNSARYNSIWHYTTADTPATVGGAGYFNAAANDLVVGDIILAVCGIGGTVVHTSWGVSANTGTAVTVTRMSTT